MIGRTSSFALAAACSASSATSTPFWSSLSAALSSCSPVAPPALACARRSLVDMDRSSDCRASPAPPPTKLTAHASDAAEEPVSAARMRSMSACFSSSASPASSRSSSETPALRASTFSSFFVFCASAALFSSRRPAPVAARMRLMSAPFSSSASPASSMSSVETPAWRACALSSFFVFADSTAPSIVRPRRLGVLSTSSS